MTHPHVPPRIKFRPIPMCFRHSDLFQLNPADIQDSAGTFSIAQDEPHCLNEKRKKKKKEENEDEDDNEDENKN